MFLLFSRDQISCTMKEVLNKSHSDFKNSKLLPCPFFLQVSGSSSSESDLRSDLFLSLSTSLHQSGPWPTASIQCRGIHWCDRLVSLASRPQQTHTNLLKTIRACWSKRWIVSHRLFSKLTLLKTDLHMVLPQTSPDYTPSMQSFKSYLKMDLFFSLLWVGFFQVCCFHEILSNITTWGLLLKAVDTIGYYSK